MVTVEDVYSFLPSAILPGLVPGQLAVFGVWLTALLRS